MRRFLRVERDLSGWRHPRPSRDPRLLMLSIGLAWVAFAQTFIVRPDTSVSAQAFTNPAAVSVAVLVVIACGCLFYAAYCANQFRSWGWELASCIGFAGQGVIQFAALVSVNDEWFAAGTFTWSWFWAAGNAWRGWILARRVLLP